MKASNVAPFAIRFGPNGAEIIDMNQGSGVSVTKGKNGTTVSMAAAAFSTPEKPDTIEEKSGFFSKMDPFGKKEADRIVSSFRNAKETLTKVDLEIRTAGYMTKKAIRDLLTEDEKKLINKLKDLV